MHLRLSSLGFVNATLLIALTSSLALAPNPLGISVALAQITGPKNSEAEVERLFQEGVQLSNQAQYSAALEKFQRLLKICQETGERQAEGYVLYMIGNVYYSQSQFPQALEILQQALAIFKEVGDRSGEGTTLNNTGEIHRNLGQYPKALGHYQQALAIAKEVGDRSGEGTTLNNIGLVYFVQGQYSQALNFYQQALAISKEVSNRPLEGTILGNIGLLHERLGKNSEALGFYQQTLTIHKEINNRNGEAVTLGNLGTVYFNLGQYSKALEFYQQAMRLAREARNRALEGQIFSSIGLLLNSLGQYPQALKSLERALAIHREISDLRAEGEALQYTGNVYLSLSKYTQSLEFYQQSLRIRKRIGDLVGEGATLSNIGEVYRNLGQYPKALELYQQALAISKKVGNRSVEGTTLNNIGLVYNSLGQYPKALEFHQQALTISKEVGDRPRQGTILNNTGEVYRNLGQYPKALEFYRQALTMSKEVGDRPGQGIALNNIGLVYDSLGEYPKALEFYQQALVIRREVGDRSGEGTILNNIGEVYRNFEQYPKALEFYQQALTMSKEVGDRPGEGRTLNNIGLVYDSLGEHPKALEFYQQALVIRREVGDRSGEGTILNNIGYTLNSQKQPELAIVFYKQSVNVRETIRQELQALPREQQESYTQTVAHTYRELADLLLQKDRVLEAQQVLDLLKVQELDDYLSNVRGNQKTAQGVETLPPEQQILSQYTTLQDQAIQLGKELTDLRKLPPASRTPAQQQRIAQLVKTESEITQQFNDFIDSPSITALVDQLSRTAKQQNLALADLNSLRDNLKQLDHAVLLYPLILDDRLELILTTPDSPPIRRTVPVKREDLNRAIVEFRKALQDPAADAKAPAQKLYNWLIKPLEADLKQAKTQTIIYAPDAQLRYIPLAALHDGQQWLVERYRFNHITARSLTDLNTKPQTQPHVLAAAFVQGNYRFQVGQRQFAFAGLTFAGREVNNLVATLPGTTQLLDKAFSRDATVPKMNEHNIVHLATHAAFVVGQPEESFILFGNGERVNLKEVGAWSLGNVDLVVLSACETGLGGQLGNGEEILGLGYQFQRTGARAAIASLWQVDDGGTQAMMNAFYEVLKQGKVTKAEALRQAQMALIQSNSKTTQQRGGLIVKEVGNQLPAGVANRLSHPYYWAPFILIGNGL